jgi:hypothetical protein
LFNNMTSIPIYRTMELHRLYPTQDDTLTCIPAYYVMLPQSFCRQPSWNYIGEA